MQPDDLRAFIAEHPLGVVSTHNAERGPEAALVSFALADDGAILFDTFADSRKMANLQANPRVAIVLGCTGSVSMQIEGVAKLPSAEEGFEWAAEYEHHFPGSNVFKSGMTVVRVRPHWIRVYDASGPSPVVRELTPGVEPASGKDRVCARDEPMPDDVARLLASVPEWFSMPDANAEYVDAARSMETWTVRDAAGAVIGVTLVRRHFDHAAEIHLTVVDRVHHGRGVGTAMLQAIEADARATGVRLIEVKTLGASHPDAGYARTRHFYERLGFLPLEETELWGADNPCLILVKPL